jgi:hypothetical protein
VNYITTVVGEHLHMNKQILIFIVFFTSFQTAHCGWEYSLRAYSIGRDKVVGVDLSTKAEEIKYSVGCNSSCDVFFLYESEFRKMINGYNFTTLRQARRVKSYTGAVWDIGVIEKHLIVAVGNKYSEKLSALFFTQQLIRKPINSPNQGTISAKPSLALIMLCIIIVLLC